MAELTTCVKCGGKVSSDAAACPHCGQFPRAAVSQSGPLPCVHCGGQVSSADAVNQMHPECSRACGLMRAKKGMLSCPVCRATHRYDAFRIPWHAGMGVSYFDVGAIKPCPACGHGLVVEKCQQCGDPMFRGTGVVVPRRTQLPLTVHEFCVPDVHNRVMPGPARSGCLAAVGLLVPLLLAAGGRLAGL